MNFRHPTIAPFLFLYTLTIVAQLISLAYGRIDEQREFVTIILPSVLFISVLTLPAIAIGIVLGPKTGLGTPLINHLIAGEPGAYHKLRKDSASACVLGILLGVLLLIVRQFTEPYLPPELPAFGHRGIIGGLAVSFGAAVAEEVWFRLGLMTLLVWGAMRITGHNQSRPMLVWAIILITAFGFGLAHLPQLLSYGADSPFAITGTIVGNIAVGVLYGWCYWRKSLIAAMVAHFSVDIILHVLPALVTV